MKSRWLRTNLSTVCLLLHLRSTSLEPYLLAARIVESIENAPPGSSEKLKALMQGYVLLGLLKLRFREG